MASTAVNMTLKYFQMELGSQCAAQLAGALMTYRWLRIKRLLHLQMATTLVIQRVITYVTGLTIKIVLISNQLLNPGNCCERKQLLNT